MAWDQTPSTVWIVMERVRQDSSATCVIHAFYDNPEAAKVHLRIANNPMLEVQTWRVNSETLK